VNPAFSGLSGVNRHSITSLSPLNAKMVGVSDDHVVVVSTTASEEAARALAAGVIEARLGACAQIVGPITSVFRWNGEVQTEQEWRLEIKTTADRVTALTAHIEDNHGYDLPEIIAIPIAGGSAGYLSWLMAETHS
jgi:periplasmic divalent cation tolerance protein